jgi:hypothetical protein
MLVWTFAVGFAVGGETRFIADYRRAYNAATNQSVVASSFYDRFTESLQNLPSRLPEHALDEVAVPHHVSPGFDRFTDMITDDATISRLQQLYRKFLGEAVDDEISQVLFIYLTICLGLLHTCSKQTLALIRCVN